MYRSNAYNEGNFYKALPVFRKAVVPGESCEIDCLVRFEIPPFLKNVMPGGVASVYAFYVPNRLVWSNWVDFIADPESGYTLPTTTVDFPEMFEYSPAGSTPLSCLPRRAYKLAYNQFFGSKDFSNIYDVNLDNVVTLNSVRTNDQWIGRLMAGADLSNPVYNAPLVGVDPNRSAEISLNDLRLAMQDAKQVRRADMTGDKYVDAMLRLGVKLDWRVQLAPEFLGAAHQEFEPSDTRASYSASDTPTAGAASTGQAYSRYQGSVSLKTKRKFFAEHGYIIGVLVVRPFAFEQDFYAPADSFVAEYKDFFLGENNQGVQTWDASYWTGAPPGTNVVTSRFEYLLSGHNMLGVQATDAWLAADISTNVDNAVYPRPLDVPFVDLLDGAQMAVYARTAINGPTPVKRNII